MTIREELDTHPALLGMLTNIVREQGYRVDIAFSGVHGRWVHISRIDREPDMAWLLALWDYERENRDTRPTILSEV